MKLSEKERFMTHVRKTRSCWLWTAGKTTAGYGWWRDGYAHRAAYRMFVGRIPKGKFICHSCDVPSCIHPRHLWAGTPADNMTDRAEKGRAPHGSGHWTARMPERVPRGEGHSSKRPEVRAKLAALNLGKRYGAATRKKHSDASRRSWKDPKVRAARIAGLKEAWR